MKRLMCTLFVAVLFISSIPAFTFGTYAEAQASQLRTVWENPFTLTTYHPNDEVNSTFYTFPKVIWNGSQYVDHILNSSDMSAGIGSVYLKVFPDHTVFYDPDRKEERIEGESWSVEHYDASSFKWKTDNPAGNDVYSLINSSGIYFDRTTTLDSGAVLDEWYWLRTGSKLKISIVLQSAVNGEYRLVWLLNDVYGTRTLLLKTTENATAQLVEDRSCSGVQFASDNESKCVVDWSDTGFFNEAAQKWITCFQELELQKDVSNGQCQAKISFGDFALTSGEPLMLDPTIVTFNSNGALDGFVEKYGQSYPPNGGTIIDQNGTALSVGQTYAPGNGGYIIDRSYVSFDTSSIPAMAYNISATLRLMTGVPHPMVNFNVQVWGGNQSVWNRNMTRDERVDQGFYNLFGSQPVYNNTLCADKWGTGTVQVATWNTTDYQQNVYINLTIPPDQINRLSSTEFELSSSREKEEIPPQMNQDELIFFYSGDSQGCEPKLEVDYCLDTVTIGTPTSVKWFYRNAGTSKAAIVLFGAIPHDPFEEIQSIDFSSEKYLGKIMFLDALVANGFSVYTPSNSTPDNEPDYYHTYYKNDSKWVQDLTMYLMYNQTYSQVYLFGVSGGAMVVGNEIQKDYATRFSAAVMSCAPVDWDSYTGTIYHTAGTASMAKVATFFPENLNDSYNFYNETKWYFGNETVQKEWMDWNGDHVDMFYVCSVSGENCSEAVINWFNAAHPPSTPFTPTGTRMCNVNANYSYSSGTLDPDGENVSYTFSWGDGTNCTTGFCTSGTNVTCNHAWNSPGSYNVTVCAQDTSQRWSCWSPPLTVEVMADGSGGCPYVYDWNGSDYVKDNNVLPASETGNGTDTQDYYLLQQRLVPVLSTRLASMYTLQVRENENEIDYIDQVKLTAVDHSQGTSVAVTPEGEILTYTSPASPVSCIDNHGLDRLSRIATVNGNVSDPSTYFQGFKDDWLLLNFGKVTEPYAKLILRDDQKCIDDRCINVQVPNGNGGWQTIEVLHPRDFWSMEAVNMTACIPANGDFIVRLLWTATHRLDYVGLDTSSPAQVQVTSAPPVVAVHSVMGIVTAKLLYDDENCVELVNGQTITLAFLLPNSGQGPTRDFILYTDGYYYTITP